MASQKTFVPLGPRPAFESASSLARALRAPLAQAAGVGRTQGMTRLAFGTVDCPLRLLAALYAGLVGSGEQLRDTRTLFAFCAIGLARRELDAFNSRVLDGGGPVRHWQLPAWFAGGLVARKLCGTCSGEAWRTFGIEADFYPHYAPGVTVCWQHETALHLATEMGPGFLDRRPRDASASEIAFARSSFVVAQMDPKQARGVFRARMAQAGYCRPDGRYHARPLRRDFEAFVAQAALPPPLTRLATLPTRCARICAWLDDEERRLHPLYIVLLDGFLAGTMAAGRSPVCLRAPGHARAGWAVKQASGPGPCPVDRRRHYEREEIPALLGRGCTCAEIATLIRTSQATVHRIVRERGYRGLCDAGFAERLRQRARAAWLSVQWRYPWMSTNQLQRYEPNALAWLRAHDAQWLATQRPVAWPAGRCRTVDPGPKGQGRAVAARLRQALAHLQAEVRAGLRRRCTRRAICRLMGIDEYALARMTRWPGVRRLLDAAGCTGVRDVPDHPPRRSP
ncbi:hypothetical protein [Cupriavidus metallidurans]|uniref:hypothetical protein n=1 Tax=Cupriavidus metallidurans TaxID=119219 RepID=UPI001BFC1B05|nr:hypothetical protein [Cupriavidus metallidurans]QWC91306.1 hypothetical protein KB891_27875 [Cupriavidus metallidurans]